MADLTDSAATALCGAAVKGLIAQGVDPVLAAAFGERACRPAVAGGIRKGVKKVKRSKTGKKMTRKTQLAINRGRKAAGMKPIKWKRKGR